VLNHEMFVQGLLFFV